MFNGKKSVLIRISIILIAFLCLYGFYLAVALAVPYNSDHATILLEAKSIIDKNFLLKGWTLSTVSYYSTEIPFYIIGILLLGNTDKIIYIVTAINYSLLTLVIIYLCSVTNDGRILPKRLLISFCFSLT